MAEETKADQADAGGVLLPAAIPYTFTDDDVALVADATSYAITDADSYRAGFDVLKALADLIDDVDAHHDRWREPLNTFRTPALAQAKRDADYVKAAKDQLARALPAWKRLADERDAAEKRRQQAEADAAARAVQEAQQKALERVAAVEADPVAKASLQAQAAAVAALPAVAAPVQVAPTAVAPKGGVVPVRWVPEVYDVRALLRAWLDGKAPALDIEQALIDAVTPKLADATRAMGESVGRVYPGVRARRDDKAQVRR